MLRAADRGGHYARSSPAGPGDRRYCRWCGSRASENRNLIVAFVITQHAVVGDVGPDEVASRREVSRPSAQWAARIETVQMGGRAEKDAQSARPESGMFPS